MSSTVPCVAAPDEPDVAVSGAETPSGGTLRRLLSRDGNRLFGSRENGSLAPPLSVPVDPLLAGPPMDAAMLESPNGVSRSENGATADVVEDDAVDDLDVVIDDGELVIEDGELAEVAGEEIDEGSAGLIDADELLAVDDDLAAEARTSPSPVLEPPVTESVDLVEPPVTVAVPALLPAPTVPEPDVEPAAARTAPAPPRRRRTRPRVRKVTRIVRYVDAWSVFKVALLLNVVLAVVMVTASVLLWNLAYSTDVIDNVEGVIEDWLAYETFTFNGEAMFRAVLVLGALFVIAATGLAVLAATLFNLVSDLTGGVKVTVLEREVVAASPTSAPKRRGAARRAAARFPPDSGSGSIDTSPGL
jgi:hypothetical protein